MPYVLSRIRKHVDSEHKLGYYFPGFQRVFEPFLRRFHSVFTLKRVWKSFKVPGIASNILRNKSALVMGICTISAPAKTWLSTRNRSFPFTSIPLWWSKFFQIERPSLSITLNRAIHCNISNQAGFWCRQPRLIIYATEINLLRSLVALWQSREVFYGTKLKGIA